MTAEDEVDEAIAEEEAQGVVEGGDGVVLEGEGERWCLSINSRTVMSEKG